MAEGMKWPQMAISIIVLVVGGHFFSKFKGSLTPETLLADVEMSESLRYASKIHSRRTVEKVTDGVYVARGFALGNSILLEGPDGLVIVDTTESLVLAREILAAFRNITKASIRAIVYTHHHADHIYGAKAFIDENNTYPEIWAHEEFLKEQQAGGPIGQTTFARAMRQFGPYLPDSQRKGVGLQFTGSKESLGFVKPTHIVKGNGANVTLAGLEVQLLHIPGETDDHLGVWIPSKRVYMSGDNIYRAFPNLYALRGSRPRDPMVWIRSLDTIRHMRPEYLVPSHTQPQYGEDHIFRLLTNYRDAIQLIHDQTVRYINKGMYPVDIVQHIKLPEELATHHFLQEVYGTVRWSVKGVYTNYLGWFSGNIVDLEPLDTKEKALRMIQLAGGVGSLAAAAQTALNKGDHRWALELSSHIFHLNPNHDQARQIRLDALKALAAAQTSGNGRNYYLTTALEDHRLVDIKVPKGLKTESIYSSSMEGVLKALSVRLKAEEVDGQKIVLVFNFTDSEEVFTLTLRNCILDVQADSTWDWDVKVTMESMLWRRLLAKEVTPLSAYFSGDIVIEGGLLIFRRFMNYIDQD